MRGVNIQKIVIEKEENEKLYKALEILNEFRNTFNYTLSEVGLLAPELENLDDDIDEIVRRLEDFLDDLGYCDYIEIEG